MTDAANITSLITCPPPTLPISLFLGPKLFPGSLEELHLSQEPPGRAQATSKQPPPLPPKMCRSVSVTNLRPTLLKPFQEGASGRSLSQENLLTEVNADPVSHSSSECSQQLFTAGPCSRHNGKQGRQNLCPQGISMEVTNTQTNNGWY